MAMLEYNEIRERKIKNLITGRVAEISFGSSEKVNEADMISRPAIFIYKAKGEIWFTDVKDKSKRFSLKEEIVGDKLKYIKENTQVDMVIFTNDDDEEQVIGVKVPIKVELEIKEAPPVIKGASANTGNKVVTLENGATINAPLFVAAGDRIRINTETGEYVERA
jgi:elongation factor P